MLGPTRWTYTVGLVGTCALLWLAAAAIPPQFGFQASFGWFGWLWWAPVSYLSAWFVLATPSLGGAVVAVLGVALAGAALTVVGMLVGMATWIILIGPPVAIIGCAFALGWVAANVHAVVAPLENKEAWRRIHEHGGLLAGVGLLVSSFFAAADRTPGLKEGLASDLVQFACVGGILGLSFSWHAVHAYRRLRAERGAAASVRRSVVLLAIAYSVPTVAFWWANPNRAALAWPIQYRAAAAERKAADAADVQFWGTYRGAVLLPGARTAVRIGTSLLELSAPSGWLARSYEADRGSGPPSAFILRPEPAAGAASTIVSRIEVGGAAWHDLAVVTPRASGGGPAAGMRSRHHDCRAAEGHDAGLALCWDASRRYLWDDFAAALGPPPGPNAIKVDLQPDALAGPIIAFGAGFRASCWTVASCRAEFKFKGRVAYASFASENMHRWSALRREVDDLLRAATGSGIEDAAAFRQPEGDILPFGAR